MTLFNQMIEAGYQPTNNIFSLEGHVMCVRGGNIPQPATLHEIHVTDSKIRVFHMFHAEETIAEFTTVEDFQAWCPRVSEFGSYIDQGNWD